MSLVSEPPEQNDSPPGGPDRTDYALLFDAVSEALFVHDMSGNPVDANLRACEMFGCDRETLLGLTFDQTSLGQSPYTFDDARVLMERTVHEGPQTFEWMSRRYDGELFWTEVALRRCSLGGQQRIIASLRDISARKEVEEEAARARYLTNSIFKAVPSVASAFDAMEQERRVLQEHAVKMETIGRLAGGIAHDFNNLLTVTQVNLDLMVGATDNELESYRRSIQTTLRRAMGLTGRLLSFSRSGDVELESLDLEHVVRDALSLFEPLLNESVVVTIDAEDGLARVRGDRALLEQVFVNLAINALDAMPSGGALRFSVANIELLADAQSELAAGPYVEVVVTDNGEGMSEQVAQRAFDPFFTTKPSGKGTGLGLASSYGTVRGSGGSITLSSKLGEGTSVRVALPAIVEDSAASES